eukprot:TRINITY_DN7104_c0_g1_i6.p1 TRINITY_DN7104_c0_g1~~TRINITY_DN7104_c0_g1_i6.p1  ORF type:complete len:276 (-),score=63.38 TRINITY_DN7104_c0_g1_i6:413-1240(-)
MCIRDRSTWTHQLKPKKRETRSRRGMWRPLRRSMTPPFHQQFGEKHKSGGDIIKSFVYGGLDGIVTTAAVASGAEGATLSLGVILILGFSHLLADALSMAFSDFLGTKAELDYQKGEREREAWEVENYPEGERLEMKEIYMEKGLSETDADAVCDILVRNKEAWIDVMMCQELGIVQGDDNPVKNGLVTFFSFIVFGIIPLISYLVAYIFEFTSNLFLAMLIMTAFTLLLLGAIKARVSGEKEWKAALETFLLGAIAIIVSYLIGWAMESLRDSE